MDVVARILQSTLSDALQQQVIIENVGGAGGMTGTAKVAKSTPDGYQFLGNVGTQAVSQTLYKQPLYNTLTDFTPVVLIADLSLVLVVRKDLPVSNLQEFIAYTKANQDKMQFASGGAGSATHLGCALLNARIGINVTHVPYRGGGAMQTAIAQRVLHRQSAAAIGNMCDMMPIRAFNRAQPRCVAEPAPPEANCICLGWLSCRQ